MKKFNYHVVSSKGETTSGVLECDTLDAAKASLQKQDLLILSIEEKKSLAFLMSLRKKRVPQKQILLFTRQLATILQAGLNLETAISICSQYASHKYFKEVLSEIYKKIAEGHSFADSLSQHKDIFSDTYVACIHAGESSGKLTLVFEELADYLERKNAVRQNTIQSLAYPSIVFTFTFLIMIVLIVMVVPKIIDTFLDSGKEIPLMTSILLWCSNIIQNYWGVILVLFAVGYYFCKWAVKQEVISKKLFSFINSLPIINYYYKLVNTTRFLQTLSMLLQSGISISHALSIASGTIPSNNMKKSLLKINESVQEGTSIHYAFKEINIFTPLTLQLIANGESVGKLPSMLKRAADIQENDLERKIKMSIVFFEPILILTVGMLVLFIVMSVLLPIFDIMHL